jgi:hypothetical protein
MQLGKFAEQNFKHECLKSIAYVLVSKTGINFAQFETRQVHNATPLFPIAQKADPIGFTIAMTVSSPACIMNARAPHPAATGGGFGLAPWENPGPRPPKAGAALSPTGQGKFRRDEQGCLVQKMEHNVHLIRPADTFSPARRRAVADGAFAQVKRPDRFI